MDERRDPQPTAEASPPILSPREARSAYRQHAAVECPRCRDVDRQRCTEGERLYRAWVGACEAAYRQLADQTP